MPTKMCIGAVVVLGSLATLARRSTGAFYWGNAPFGEGELPDLNGRTTLRRAVLRCERHPECAGFTLRGSFLDLDSLEHDVAFYRYVPGVFQDDPKAFDWTTFLVDRPLNVYDKALFEGIGRNAFVEFHSSDIYSLKKAQEVCLSQPACAAISVSTSGRIRQYSLVDLRSRTFHPEWTTLLKTQLNATMIRNDDAFDSLDYCCPEEIPYFDIQPEDETIVDSIERVFCNISREEFVTRFVRTETPVLLQGCETRATDDEDMSVEAIIQMLHGNSTVSGTRFGKFEPSRPGFTHIYTPNDFEPKNDEIMDALNKNEVRVFDRIDSGANCSDLKCLILKSFKKPYPIPDDLYDATGFKHDYSWIITSNKGTGSHPHTDPDLTGAWNYLFNGVKYWVIFPKGVAMRHVMCDEECSPYINVDPKQTWRWFMHVLPQLRHKTFYGKRLQEGIQKAGESIYLPHGRTHAVLNLQDNVAMTKNQLFVDALPELVKMIALDEISLWRPGWDYNAWKRLYYGGFANKEVVMKVRRRPESCNELENERMDRWKSRCEESEK